MEMHEITVTLPIQRYNELLKIEQNSIESIEVEIIQDEAISDAIQSIFVMNQKPIIVEKITGVKIIMVEHPIVSDVHIFSKLLIIKKIKKSIDEKNSSTSNS